jgi:hypothetical protein
MTGRHDRRSIHLVVRCKHARAACHGLRWNAHWTRGMRGVEVRLPLTDTHAVSTPEPKPWWRFSFAYYVGFAALGAIALAYGFLPAALAILSLIAGLAGALYVGLQMLSLRSSSATRRAAWAEDVSWSLPYALVAGMLILRSWDGAAPRGRGYARSRGGGGRCESRSQRSLRRDRVASGKGASPVIP